jgi:hypothetical protein
LLLAYKAERNKSQAHKAIAYGLGKELHMGRDILPLTQELIDLGLVKRTNPNAPAVSGHKHVTTTDGCQAIENYFNSLESISHPNPRFGF